MSCLVSLPYVAFLYISQHGLVFYFVPIVHPSKLYHYWEGIFIQVHRMQLTSNLLTVFLIVIGSITVLANGIFKVTLLTSKTTDISLLCFSSFNPMYNTLWRIKIQFENLVSPSLFLCFICNFMLSEKVEIDKGKNRSYPLAVFYIEIRYKELDTIKKKRISSNNSWHPSLSKWGCVCVSKCCTRHCF